MARGFAAVEGKLPDLEGKDIGTILKTVGMTLVSTVGGASGPLYGSAYMKAGMALAGKDEMDMDDFLSMMDTAGQGGQWSREVRPLWRKPPCWMPWYLP